MHWVTLYDSLDDDLFEGHLGIDDDFDYPKALIEYSIVSSKFTSMINQAEEVKDKVNQARRKIDRNKNVRSEHAGAAVSEKSRSMRGTAKAVRTVTAS